MICTPNIMQKLSSEQLNLFSTKFNYLFFDEAHHIAAPTRERLKREFVKKNKKILQFTATPFRNDKKSI
ncbi:TPA: hypothetical protein DCZ39_04575 [Patescibacteria group bacterium]|nr:hypothetical protein [Candidatus Gracilibacteria bacterium]